MDEKIDKRTKEYKESVKEQAVVYEQGSPEAARAVMDADGAKEITKNAFATRENNPKFALCMHCGAELPPNEDGSPKFRKYPEPCDDCIWRKR